MDPRCALVLTVAFAVAVAAAPTGRPWSLVVYAGLLSWAAAWAGVGFGRLALRAAAVLPLALAPSAWLLLAAPADRPAAAAWAAALGAKAWLGAAAAALLVTTVAAPDVLAGLRGLGLPAVFVDVLGVAWRYLDVLADEARRLRTAATARGYRPRWLRDAPLLGSLAGALFLRGLGRAERVHGALLQRGFRGAWPGHERARVPPRDLLALASSVVLLAAVGWFA